MSEIRIVPLTGSAGAEIYGADLDHPLSPDDGRAVVEALDRHGVIFFPPHGVSEDLLVRLAAVIGDPVTPAVPDKGKHRQEIREFVSQPVAWHADTTWMDTPPGEQIFQVVELPEVGGDTLWSSTETAYQTLSPRLRTFVDGLTAIHDDGRILSHFAGTEGGPSAYHFAEHPVVRVHPRSGRRSLFVNPLYTSRIVGLSEVESRHLLELLFAHIVLPEHFVRYRWKEGSVAVWDNRSTWHYAVGDYGKARRRVQRVSTRGERPIGLAGIDIPGSGESQ